MSENTEERRENKEDSEREREGEVQREAASVRRKGGHIVDNVLLHRAGECECLKVAGCFC